MIIAKLENVDLSKLKQRDLLECYQEHSIDFKFEEALREGEIKEFADYVIPKSKFIFDNYKVTDDDILSGETKENTDEDKADDSFFSFFASHERIIMKPESSFKNLREMLVQLPIDYYILL